MTTATSINGLSLEAVQGLVDLVKDQPAISRATFYTTIAWKGGFQNQAAIRAFSLGGAKNQTSRPQPFTVSGDHPQESRRNLLSMAIASPAQPSKPG